jgi:Fur family transcriptional regulator, zinc uptake regulator
MGDSCHHTHQDGPPDAKAVGAALAEVEHRLSGQGERMTAARTRVLELLLSAGEPVKAYDLIARFGTDGAPAKPPTVYRSLEFLERHGLVHRIASISAYVACTSGTDAHAAAFLICDCCGATQEVSATLAEGLDAAAASAGYVIERTTIEAHGRCSACV